MGEEQFSESVKEARGERDKKEVAITYETLFELLRREKNRDELQKLQDCFFDDAVKYMQGKMSILSNPQSELFATDEREKTLIQLQNIKKILRDLYDRREKKIINLAINKARTGSSIIDTSALLNEEKAIFETLHCTLESYRRDILNNIIDAKLPRLCEAGLPPNPGDISAEKGTENEAKEVNEKGQALNISSKEQDSCAEKPKCVSIRFLSPIPQFAGPDLRLYGPFEEDDAEKLPESIANVLLSKGRAELSDE